MLGNGSALLWFLRAVVQSLILVKVRRCDVTENVKPFYRGRTEVLEKVMGWWAEQKWNWEEWRRVREAVEVEWRRKQRANTPSPAVLPVQLCSHPSWWVPHRPAIKGEKGACCPPRLQLQESRVRTAGLLFEECVGMRINSHMTDLENLIFQKIFIVEKCMIYKTMKRILYPNSASQRYLLLKNF